MTTDNNIVLDKNIPKKEFTLKQPRRSRRKFDFDKLKETMEEALQTPRYPPSSVSEIAKHLHYDLATLWKTFPEECREISARYQEFLTAKKLERIEAEQNAVLHAIYVLHSEGLYPTERRVKRLLKQPGIFRSPEINKLWKETIQDLSRESKRPMQ